MKKNKISIFWWVTIASIILWSPASHAVEPDMSDYTAYPIFLSQSVAPNIFVMLDNSGSMNFNAYGSYPGDSGTVSDAPYDYCDVRIIKSEDDSEETLGGGGNWYDHSDLDLGSFDLNNAEPSMIGLRFQNVTVPQGATITKAYIEFTANDADNEVASYTIQGEAIDHAAQFTADNKHISNRAVAGKVTAASVLWQGADMEDWTANVEYETPDLSTIVQEIVNRAGWSGGNAMAFIINGTGKRDAKSYNNSSSEAPRLVIEYDGEAIKYYGYFDPDSKYDYGSNIFTRSATGDFSGNWLNWLCMRRIDVLRKVLMGGLATSRTGGGNTTLIGEDPNQSFRVFNKWFDGTGKDETPYTGKFRYEMEDGYIKVYNEAGAHVTDYTIKVDKTTADEAQDFLDGNISGVLQRVGDKARWGNMWFKSGSGTGQNGGMVANRVGTNITTLITTLQNKGADTSTPLAESYFVAMRYFMQKKISENEYDNNAIGATNNTMDPYYNDVEHVPCAKSFVILLTDGASTRDRQVPLDLDGDGTPDLDANHDYDGDGKDTTGYSSYGTDYLDDVALFARTNDLRSDLDGDQNLMLYTVYAFGSDDNARSLLKDAARNGAFEDRNGNNRPDGDYASPPEDRLEWDKNGDGDPDTYYEAQDGYKLERELLKAITDILQRASSGTAASVLTSNRGGDGNMVQSYFRPTVIEGTREVNWIGYLQMLWMDDKGNIREDTPPHDYALDKSKDRIIQYFQDPLSGDTKIRRFEVGEGNEDPDMDPNDGDGIDDNDVVSLEEVSAIFEAGKLLHQRDPSERKIFTYIDKDGNKKVDDGADPLDNTGELIRFDVDTAGDIKPYLGVRDGAKWAYLGGSHDERVENLIKFIRGTEMADLRDRTLTIDGVESVWKLGDIVHCSPFTAAEPTEEFNRIYANSDYATYMKAMRDRENVIIVGGNDGMLHGFTSWNKVVDPASGNAIKFEDPGIVAGEKIGDEVWAYIPQTLLPHLKWLADPEYTHVYYVDGTPFVFDARIFDHDEHYVDGNTYPNWGQVLIMGLRMGGKRIPVEGDFGGGGGVEVKNFDPTYICMDITDPRNPKLLWERTFEGQGMSSFQPGAVKIGRLEKGETEKWYAVIGSGYTDYDATSNQKAKIYVVDLKTGEPLGGAGNEWLFEFGNDTYINRPITLDVSPDSGNIDFEVDAAYFSETLLQGGKWKSNLWRLSTWQPGTRKPVVDPSLWTIESIFSSPGPITAPVSLGVDGDENVWVYFGTGRFLAEGDKTDSATQYAVGIKDPLFAEARARTTGVTIVDSDLLDVTEYVVTTTGDVYPGNGSCIKWGEFVDEIQYEDASDPKWTDGWYRNFETGTPSERCISKMLLVCNSLLFPSYTPNEDICGYGGSSRFFSLYNITGTGYWKDVFDVDYDSLPVGACGSGHDVTIVVDLGQGSPPDDVGVHDGDAVVQLSTGIISGIKLKSLYPPVNRVTNWLEK
jgi:type IV pilus assembly protein PilY1